MYSVWKMLTLLVGLGVALIAYQQFKLGREKLKLDLFEMRFSVFAATRKALSDVLADAKFSTRQLFEYRGGIAEATFLFGSDINTYLDEIDHKLVRMIYTSGQIAVRPIVPNYQQLVEEDAELLEWLTDQLPELKTRFSPYMKFHVWRK